MEKWDNVVPLGLNSVFFLWQVIFFDVILFSMVILQARLYINQKPEAQVIADKFRYQQ